MPLSDARKFPRVDLQLEVYFAISGEQHKAITTNISRGGAYIQTETTLGVGDPLQLKLRLPGVQDSLDIRARVVWVNDEPTKAGHTGAGMGVKFVAADVSDLALLESPWSWI
jgi:uncharacterized protein (TIGR02266 family)